MAKIKSNDKKTTQRSANMKCWHDLKKARHFREWKRRQEEGKYLLHLCLGTILVCGLIRLDYFVGAREFLTNKRRKCAESEHQGFTARRDVIGS
jgi:hypothetical protein